MTIFGEIFFSVAKFWYDVTQNVGNGTLTKKVTQGFFKGIWKLILANGITNYPDCEIVTLVSLCITYGTVSKDI